MYALCFKIIDKVTCKFDLKIKKALPINWGKPNLNVTVGILEILVISFVL